MVFFLILYQIKRRLSLRSSPITTLNFVGSGIAAAVSGNTATITSSGGASTDDVVALAIALG